MLYDAIMCISASLERGGQVCQCGGWRTIEAVLINISQFHKFQRHVSNVYIEIHSHIARWSGECYIIIIVLTRQTLARLNLGMPFMWKMDYVWITSNIAIFYSIAQQTWKYMDDTAPVA